MRRKRLLTASVLLCALAQGTPAAADQRCGALLTSRCQECHHKTRICQALGSKSKSEWSRTVQRMKGYGAKINQQEAKHLAACLAAAPAGAAHVCND